MADGTTNVNYLNQSNTEVDTKSNTMNHTNIIGRYNNKRSDWFLKLIMHIFNLDQTDLDADSTSLFSNICCVNGNKIKWLL